jgi:acetate kinase
MPSVSRQFALPEHITALGVERYGFHGLSLESIMRRIDPPPAKLVVAHLGGGCSVTAIRDGKSIDTTMGLTPSGGMMMGTRSGDLDPGVILYLIRQRAPSASELETWIDHEAGLLGVSGRSADFRTLQEAANTDVRSKLALDMFLYQLKKQIASMAASLGGLDLLVLTGGIGEHNPQFLDLLRQDLPFLGLFEGRVMNSEEDLRIAEISSSLVWS